MTLIRPDGDKLRLRLTACNGTAVVRRMEL